MEPVAPSRRIGEGTDIYAARRVGRLSLDTVHDFISTMRAEPASLLVLDMAEVSFLDSAGVGAIVALFVGRSNSGKRVAFAGLPKHALAVLQVPGLMDLLPVYTSVNLAIHESEGAMTI